MTGANLISIIISSLSVLISAFSVLYSWFNNKDKLTIKWHTKMFHLSIPSIFISNYPLIPPTFTKMKGHSGLQEGSAIHDPYLVQITIINYGNNDIGYFGLKITDQNKHSYPILTKHLLYEYFGLRYLLRMAKDPKSHKYVSQWRSVHIPNDVHGILRAHGTLLLVDITGKYRRYDVK